MSERKGGNGGEAGIRTLGTAFRPYNGLANRRLQPLGHLTAVVKCNGNQQTRLIAPTHHFVPRAPGTAPPIARPPARSRSPPSRRRQPTPLAAVWRETRE